MDETEVLPRQKRSQDRLRIVVTAGPDTGKTMRIDRPIRVGSSELCELVIADRAISRRHCAIEAHGGRARVKDEDSKNGVWIGELAVREVEVAPGTEISIGADTKLRIEIDRFAAASGSPPVLSASEPGFGGFIGRSPALAPMYELVKKAALSDATVLIEGESGTGKELLAEAIHAEGARNNAHFVVLDCGAIPESLVESELFGHERGAFTGAEHQRIGAFEAASKGTLLLDEIGELPLSAQTRLLGVLDRRQFRRVGGTEAINADVRIIAATNRNLEREVEEGRFRLDLFHRLAVCVVKIPPLRDRTDDIELIARSIARDLSAEALLDPQTIEKLRRHSWPGNVRELRNWVERLVHFGANMLTQAQAQVSAAPAIEAIVKAGSGQLPYRQARQIAVDRFTELYVEAILARHGGNVSRAAQAAGIARRHFHRLKR